MSTPALTMSDSATMVRRSLKHLVRYPSMTVLLVGFPIVFLLLFVFVFGGTLGAGLPGVAAGGRAEYLEYLVPGILLVTVASTAQGTAISVATDMTEGIVARFRTMAIARVSVLTGHVVGSVVQAMLSVLIVFAVALALGFRPTGSPLGWLGAAGVVAGTAFALTWLSVALAMVSKSVETASNLPMPLVFLPFLSSGFVPAESMPAGLRWFAEYQPFTPVIETVRGLLMGTAVAASTVWLALGWAAVIALGGYLWARKLYDRLPASV
jgi:ABC-2 type transport system permease protein